MDYSAPSGDRVKDTGGSTDRVPRDSGIAIPVKKGDQTYDEIHLGHTSVSTTPSNLRQERHMSLEKAKEVGVVGESWHVTGDLPEDGV